jgi:cell division protein FtsL
MDPALIGRLAVALALLVGSLGLLTWRQSRAFETHVELEEVRRTVSLARAEGIELQRQIQVLQSRSRIVPVGRDLGLHTPDASEQVILAVGGRP